MATVTRADLAGAVHKEMGLPRREAVELVETVIEAIAERLAAGGAAKTSGFGSFSVRGKGPRMGRNSRTGEAVPIPARRVVALRASRVLKKRMGERMLSAR